MSQQDSGVPTREMQLREQLEELKRQLSLVSEQAMSTDAELAKYEPREPEQMVAHVAHELFCPLLNSGHCSWDRERWDTKIGERDTYLGIAQELQGYNQSLGILKKLRELLPRLQS